MVKQSCFYVHLYLSKPSKIVFTCRTRFMNLSNLSYIWQLFIFFLLQCNPLIGHCRPCVMCLLYDWNFFRVGWVVFFVTTIIIFTATTARVYFTLNIISHQYSKIGINNQNVWFTRKSILDVALAFMWSSAPLINHGTPTPYLPQLAIVSGASRLREILNEICNCIRPLQPKCSQTRAGGFIFVVKFKSNVS